jgi:hypothetical protein
MGQADNQTPLLRFLGDQENVAVKAGGGVVLHHRHRTLVQEGPRCGGREPAPGRWGSELETEWSWLAGTSRSPSGHRSGQRPLQRSPSGTSGPRNWSDIAADRQ